MQRIPICADDLEDVKEMSKKLEKHLYRIAKDQELGLVISALLSTVVNFTLSQCQNTSQVEFYRNCFFTVFTKSIEMVKSRNLED